ncbi:MAG TPA: HAD-IA family hydrolase, partial [Candidatus Omnitrophota bacterium]|nr:HAD-IA family hydrolase [Candidatus Omnitrophota bacterium]
FANLVHTARGIIRGPPEFNVLISAQESLRWSKVAHSVRETNTICFHPYFLTLPRVVQEDILRHELAHLAHQGERGGRRISYEYFKAHPLELAEFIVVVDNAGIPIEKRYLARLRKIYYQQQHPGPKQLSGLVYYFFSTFLPAVQQRVSGSVAVIIFDLDNTLYDSDELAQKYDQALLEFIRCRRPFLSAAEIEQRVGSEKSHSRICRMFGLSAHDYHEYLTASIDLSRYLQPNPELQGVLHRLSEDYPLVLLTNNCEAMAYKTLEYLKIKKYFSRIITQDDFPSQKEKPHPEAFRIVLRDFNIDSSQAIMVGDNLDSDIHPARSLGMYAILVKGDNDVVEALPTYIEFIKNGNNHLDGGARRIAWSGVENLCWHFSRHLYEWPSRSPLYDRNKPVLELLRMYEAMPYEVVLSHDTNYFINDGRFVAINPDIGALVVFENNHVGFDIVSVYPANSSRAIERAQRRFERASLRFERKLSSPGALYSELACTDQSVHAFLHQVLFGILIRQYDNILARIETRKRRAPWSKRLVSQQERMLFYRRLIKEVSLSVSPEEVIKVVEESTGLFLIDNGHPVRFGNQKLYFSGRTWIEILVFYREVLRGKGLYAQARSIDMLRRLEAQQDGGMMGLLYQLAMAVFVVGMAINIIGTAIVFRAIAQHLNLTRGSIRRLLLLSMPISIVFVIAFMALGLSLSLFQLGILKIACVIVLGIFCLDFFMPRLHVCRYFEAVPYKWFCVIPVSFPLIAGPGLLGITPLLLSRFGTGITFAAFIINVVLLVIVLDVCVSKSLCQLTLQHNPMISTCLRWVSKLITAGLLVYLFLSGIEDMGLIALPSNTVFILSAILTAAFCAAVVVHYTRPKAESEVLPDDPGGGKRGRDGGNHGIELRFSRETAGRIRCADGACCFARSERGFPEINTLLQRKFGATHAHGRKDIALAFCPSGRRACDEIPLDRYLFRWPCSALQILFDYSPEAGFTLSTSCRIYAEALAFCRSYPDATLHGEQCLYEQLLERRIYLKYLVRKSALSESKKVRMDSRTYVFTAGGACFTADAKEALDSDDYRSRELSLPCEDRSEYYYVFNPRRDPAVNIRRSGAGYAVRRSDGGAIPVKTFIESELPIRQLRKLTGIASLRAVVTSRDGFAYSVFLRDRTAQPTEMPLAMMHFTKIDTQRRAQIELMLDPALRGKGIGTFLYKQFMEPVCRAMGSDFASVLVSQNNLAGLTGFWRKQGFNLCCRINNPAGEYGDPEFLFLKDLRMDSRRLAELCNTRMGKLVTALVEAGLVPDNISPYVRLGEFMESRKGMNAGPLKSIAYWLRRERNAFLLSLIYRGNKPLFNKTQIRNMSKASLIVLDAETTSFLIELCCRRSEYTGSYVFSEEDICYLLGLKATCEQKSQLAHLWCRCGYETDHVRSLVQGAGNIDAAIDTMRAACTDAQKTQRTASGFYVKYDKGGKDNKNDNAPENKDGGIKAFLAGAFNNNVLEKTAIEFVVWIDGCFSTNI